MNSIEIDNNHLGIRVRNFRSFVDSNYIDLAPITCFLGNNSSGKSSLLRIIPLLKQSFEKKTRGSVLWWGNLVDFGTFSNALNHNVSEDQPIIFEFKIPASFKSKSRYHNYYFEAFSDAFIERKSNIFVKITLQYDAENAVTKTTEVEISFDDQYLHLKFDFDGSVKSIMVNGYDHTDFYQGCVVDDSSNFMPSITREEENQMRFWHRPSQNLSKKANDGLMRWLKKFAAGNTNNKTLHKIVRQIRLGSKIDIWNSMLENASGLQYLKRNLEDISFDGDEFDFFNSLILSTHTNEIISYCAQFVYEVIISSNYIEPLRATAQRYYRSQELSVDQIDPRGDNTVMFLRNLPQEELSSFNSWCDINFGFKIKLKNEGGHYELLIRDGINSEYTNLADMGFGYSQILPAIIQLWSASDDKSLSRILSGNSIMCLFEQPELHLHPNLQALFADSVIAAIKRAKDNGIQLRVIMETHSEAIIQRLGRNIAKKNLNPKNCNIVLFEKNDTKCGTSVRNSYFTDDGILNNWPLGFFSTSRPL